MKTRYLVITIILILLVSLAVRYYPIFYKGYSVGFGTVDLLLARNLSLTGEYKMVDDKDVILSSSLIEEKGVLSNRGNKLAPILHSKIFDIFGFNQDVPLYVSLILYSLTTVLLFLLVLKLFNFKLALIFVGLDISIPFVLMRAVQFGTCEWAILFFTIALLIYLWKKKPASTQPASRQGGRGEPGSWRLLLSGSFIGLAALARDSFLISFIPFVLYDIYFNVFRGKKIRLASLRNWLWPTAKRGMLFALPVIVLWGGFLAYDYYSEGIVNHYLAKGDVGYNGHLFRDPYTYHFEKEEYIKSIEGTSRSKHNQFLIKYGYKISIKNKILMYYDSARYYVNNLIRLGTLGGPFILLFAAVGILYLWKKKKYLIILFGFWLAIWYFFLICLKTNNTNHFLEIRFPLILLIAGGVYWLVEHIWKSNRDKFKYVLLLLLLVCSLLHFGQVNRVMFHDVYQDSDIEEELTLVEEIKKSPVDKRGDVIATSRSPEVLNYYTDLNYIYFTPETINKLLKENKLQWAFAQFRVTKIVGYTRKLTEEMLKVTDVENIATFE